LFVDDEPRLLEGLRRMLRPLRREWDMAFAADAFQALELLKANPFDVVVTDMQMRGMDGAQLLEQVRGQHPRAVRIVLTGQSSREAVLRAVRVAHCQLSKPCDPEVLKATVRRACALRDLLHDPTLLTLLSRLESIPSLPATYAEVIKEMESADPSLQKIGQVIARDVGMSAKILQMIHSAFFGIGFHVSGPEQAVILLGAETTKYLVLAAHIFTSIDPARVWPFSIEAVLAHSQRVSGLAREVARAEGLDRKEVEHAAMAGLLHDTGKVILAGYLPDRYREVLALERGRGLGSCDAERPVFGATHAEVGAYLLGLWGLPDPIVEAVAWHHRPADCPAHAFGPLAAVHIADGLAHDETGGSLNGDYLARLGVAGRVGEWRELLGQAAEHGGKS
jgi:putative nucleotidyltransferase with HDIG domain